MSDTTKDAVLLTECVEWPGSRNKDGYGTVKRCGKFFLAHRFTYCQHKNISIESIKDLVVRHACDNPPCVNPKHLLIGTHADNTRDKVDRDRHPKGDGWKLVPVEPTEEMIQAACLKQSNAAFENYEEWCDSHSSGISSRIRHLVAGDYLAMLAASPAAPAQSGEPVATVESWTNGSYHRNYKLTWHKEVEAGAKLYAAPLPAQTAPARQPLSPEARAFYARHEASMGRVGPSQPSPTAAALDDEPLWDHKGNVRHDAVDRLGERQRAARAASPQPVEQTRALTDQEIYDKFDFLEGVVNETTYRQIARKAIEIARAAARLASGEKE